MTEQEINKAIAEACGWTDIRLMKNFIGLGEVSPPVMMGVFNGNDDVVPDYCNDLNAMHEAENILNAVERRIYIDHLSKVFEAFVTYSSIWKRVNATARQRAEAFLRTLSLWVE